MTANEQWVHFRTIGYHNITMGYRISDQQQWGVSSYPEIPMTSPYCKSRSSWLTWTSWDLLMKNSMTSLVVQFWVDVTTAQGQKGR